MTTTSALDPTGGLEGYVAAQDWHDDFDAEAEQIAVMYSGGTLGALAMSDASPTDITMENAAGHQHQVIDSGNTGVAHVHDAAWTIGGLGSSFRANFTLRGLRFTDVSGLFPALASYDDQSGVTAIVENCLFSGPFTQITMGPISNAGAAKTATCIFRQNAVYIKGLASAGTGPRVHVGAAAIGAGSVMTVTGQIYNNLVVATGVAPARLLSFSGTAIASGVVTVNGTWRNNDVFGAATADYSAYAITGSPTINVTASHNASSDSTADDWGGDGNLINRVAADWLRNSVSDGRPRRRSPGNFAGTLIAGLTTDALGWGVPQGAPHIGPVAYREPLHQGRRCRAPRRR